MSQASYSLPHFSTFELLLADYEVAIEEKSRAYAAADVPDAHFDAEAACDAAYEAVEMAGDMILAQPARSHADLAIKARVLLARDPYHMTHYRPEDLTRFVQEVRSVGLP